MSLLNQMLQDLDDRAPPGEPQPVRLSVASAANTPTTDQDGDGPDWVRVGAGGAVVVAFVAAVWFFYGTDKAHSNGQASVQTAIGPTVSAVRNAPVSAPASTVKSAEVRVADSADASGPQPAIAVAPPTVQIKTADREVRLGRQSEPAVSEVPSAVPVMAPPADQRETDADPSEPTAVAYLPLRNTELPIKEQAAPEAVDTTPKAGISVKTPKAPQLHAAERARLAIGQGELSEAESILQRQLRRAPGDKEARELLVGLMLRGERYDAVAEQLDEGLKRHPGHVKFSLIKARLLAQFGEMAAATEILEQSKPSATGRVERLQMLGALYQQQSRYNQAIDSYRQLLELIPSAGTAWVGLAISLDGLGDTAALQAYERALRLGGLPAAADSYARQRVSQLELGVD